ncbi:hypothetical protein O181_098274 [Austropuccinia psidii MF-1]|uniref:Uncharacterized protein n=1 Tax=Austropuccinia psidii MF-1 TaxID=1389203 RepID=A0A9Q3PED4_9BASI|nr:hypothetical protein [Austropuccinia psidii MF-1]
MDTNIICICFRCCALCALSRVSPAFAPPQRPILLMLANKHTKNACLLCDHSNHVARGDPAQDALVRTPLWLTMMKAFPSGNGRQDAKQVDGNNSGQLAWSPQVLTCPTPLLGHHPMVTSLLDPRKVIIRPMKEGNGNRIFDLGPIVTMSCHPWDSNVKNQIPGNKTLRELTLPPFVEPSQYNEPPIPGPSPSSEPHQDFLACGPEPKVAPRKSLEEPFDFPTTPHLVIISDNTPVGSSTPTLEIPAISPKDPTSSSPQSHNEAWQDFIKL